MRGAPRARARLQSWGVAIGGRGSDPAEGFRYLDGHGQVGVIASVTHSFCSSCDRVRLTAEGQLRNCLFAVDEFDLGAKWAGHSINQVHFIKPKRGMSQIGG